MKTKQPPLISLIIPVYNEEANIEWFYERIEAYMSSKDFRWEAVYIDDGSSDKSYKLLERIFDKHQDTVQVLSFSRNFGKEIATTAGLHACKGDVAIMIDADGQHPIELVETMIESWKSGKDIVIGVRTSNKNEGFVKKYGSIMFYQFMNKVLKLKMTRGSTDFRLISRKVIDSFDKFSEHGRMTRGIIDWMGYDRELVEFKASERTHGVASYSYYKLMRLALDGIISHSTKPLQLSGFLGVIVMVLSCMVGVLLILNLILGDPYDLNITGSATLGVFLSFMIGLVLFCQGLLALYIENIYKETQNRPLYIIDNKL